VVNLDQDIEGFVPLSQLGWDELQSPDKVLRAGDKIPLRVIEVVPSSRRIVLSVTSYFNGRSQEELQAFRAGFEGRPPLDPSEIKPLKTVEETFGDPEAISAEAEEAEEAGEE
jgi:small subunit ribosomal protein S1